MTDLLPRIKELLTWVGGGPASFADTIGLPRPVMSHILAGRNKPSLEVVQKIMARFPEVQAQWLLLGQGQMLKDLDNSSQETNGPIIHPPETSFGASAGVAEENTKSIKEEMPVPNPAYSALPASVKKVKQVLLIYEDGTFESFHPHL